MVGKPPHGQPCNGCGQCCAEQLCPLAAMVFAGPVDRRCPALESGGDRFICGLVSHPMVYAMQRSLLYGADVVSKAAMHLVGAGRGCDAQLENEPADEEFRARMRLDRNVALTDKSLQIWGLSREK